MEEIRILSPCGMLGYGFPEKSFRRGMEKKPHAICVDAGSTDGGPQKLGAGVGITSRIMVKRDLNIMISAGLEAHIPVMIGSAGGSGGKPHIDWTLSILHDLAKENGWKLKVAVIDATIDKSWLKEQLRAEKIEPLDGVPELTEVGIDEATEIVAQMGYESYLPALEAGVDVIVGGRSYDPAMTTAVCVKYGMDEGLSYHLGKILECGALCAMPGSAKDCMLGTVRKDEFLVEVLNPERQCTTYSVAAHTLYEKTHPYHLPGPGGTTDLSGCTFEQVNPQTVRVKGSKFIRGEEYMVKLEGARESGYRAIFIAGMRDPLGISRIDEIIQSVKAAVAELMPRTVDNPAFFCDYKVYGRNAVLRETEPVQDSGHEICIVGEFVGPTQEEASAYCSISRSTMLHYHYTGRYATAGNLAFPFAPSDFAAGKCYEFNVYHLVPIEDPVKFFPTRYEVIE